MALSTYLPGASVRFSVSASLLGVLFTTTPIPVLTVHGPDGTILTPAVVTDSTGNFHGDAVLPFPGAPGKWSARWRAVGADPSNSGIVEYPFLVQALAF
jgi:hypothetical protein